MPRNYCFFPKDNPASATNLPDYYKKNFPQSARQNTGSLILINEAGQSIRSNPQ